MSNADSTRHLRGIAGIRKRPAMYIGGTDFFGFVHYVVSAFDLMLEHGATFVEIEFKDSIRLSSDAQISTSLNNDGDILPFEAVGSLQTRRQHSPDAAILAALSETFRLSSSDGVLETTLEYAEGHRGNFQQDDATSTDPSFHLDFLPDQKIFSVTEISPFALHSYCRRISSLYPGVAIRIRSGDDVTEYKSDQGIRDFFDAVSTPYQILHKPVHICESTDDLQVEAVFVFHSWSESRIWSFANRGRVPDGGTHETGLLQGITTLNANTPSGHDAGILGVLAIQYPHVTYEGCIKARIGNPELIELVASHVTHGLKKWIKENEDEVYYLSQIERFRFAEEW